MSFNIAILGSDISSRLFCLSLVLGGWHGGDIYYVKNSLIADSTSVPRGGNPKDSQNSDKSDNRCLALSLSSVNFLRSLGVWDGVCDAACPVSNIHLYGGDSSHIGNLLNFTKPFSSESLAYIVPLSSLKSSIDAAFALNCGEVNLISDKIIVRQKDRYMLGKTCIDLLVLTSGKSSSLDKNISLPGYLYDKGISGDTAISAKLEVDAEHHNKALQIFLPDGPIAFLPIKSPNKNQHDKNRHDKNRHYVSMIWSFNSKHLVKNYSYLSSSDFVSVLNSAIPIEAYRFIDCGELNIFPLRRYFRRYHSGSDLVFLGSGCHSLHPLAGQNFNLTLGDIACLSGHLHRCYDIGAFGSLGVFIEDYAAERQSIILSFLALSESLNTGFSHKNDYLRGACRFGLGFVDGLEFAKDFFIRRASH